jgi:hypothetical protein
VKPSSRARLNRTTIDAFPGTSLRDKLGRAVSEAECLPRKEFFESWYAARKIRRWFRGGPVFEVAAGHGLLSAMLLLLDGTSGPALCVDKRKPLSVDRLHGVLAQAWPRLADQIDYREARVEDVEVPEGALVVSVHACGVLTDRVLAKALEARARVAVLPCCHATKLSDTAGLEAWLEPRLAVDVVRAERLRHAGYQVRLGTIPAEVTPQNRLILAEPR